MNDPEEIYTALVSASAVTELLSTPDAVFEDVAPPDARPPFIVYGHQSGVATHAFAGLGVDDDTWLVKAVDRGDSSTVAAQINDQIELALYPAGFRRRSPVSYREPDGAESWIHRGRLYRRVTDRD